MDYVEDASRPTVSYTPFLSLKPGAVFTGQGSSGSFVNGSLSYDTIGFGHLNIVSSNGTNDKATESSITYTLSKYGTCRCLAQSVDHNHAFIQSHGIIKPNIDQGKASLFPEVVFRFTFFRSSV